jgi:hypothetical protein
MPLSVLFTFVIGPAKKRVSRGAADKFTDRLEFNLEVRPFYPRFQRYMEVRRL